MICEERIFKTLKPCGYRAKFMVIAPGAPRVVCGVHARQFLQKVLIPLKLFGPNFNVDKFPDINGFLREMDALGAEISITGTTLVINIKVES